MAALVGSPRSRIIAGRAGGVGLGHRLRARACAGVLRHWPSAWTWLCAFLTVAERRALHRHQLVADRQEVLADDVQRRGRHQVVDVGDAAGDRVLDRDHAELGLARRDRREGVLEGGAGQGRRRPDRPSRQAMCELAPGSPWKAMLCRVMASRSSVMRSSGAARSARARSRSAGVSTPSGTVVDEADVDAHAGLERAQLLQPLAPLERRGRQRDEALQRGAAIGVEADMVEEVALAPGRRGAGEIERPQPARARSACRPP